jgi:3-methyladenine DNA glycosylase/8-oxoguanine DNA glycosylase
VGDEMPRRRVLPANGVDPGHAVQTIGIYGHDVTQRHGRRTFERAVVTPAGLGAMRLSWDDVGVVVAEAWGDGSEWLLDRAPNWAGATDDPSGFDTSLHPRVAEWARRHGPVHLPASGLVWQELLPVLIGQRVTVQEAQRSWNRICRTWGEPAPGPCELQLPPTPQAMAALSYVDLHGLNVERRRADAILLAAKRAGRLEEAATMAPTDAIARLSALPGLGAWTATATVIACHGDPDTILLRDYALPTTVNFAFTGDATRVPPDAVGDEIMCGHLAPWAGHRQRVIRLIRSAGVSVPRRAPRAFNPDIRRL